MSKQIDEKVVSMQLDNRNFESNAKTSMRTLDKLEEKLNFKGVSKGVDTLGNAVKKLDMSPLSKGVQDVHAKFSALEVMGVTALANITNSAVNAGKRIVSALTIDPIKTGLSEYEIKMNAVQVIQSNTRGKNTMDDITAALEELNVYADKTIYNFAQMTNNVGKFVAQGLDVQEATKAVQGMANLAAASGASAEDMARATYQMSQALGGTIRKIDWNSLRNANMATVDLKNTLMDLAKVHGIAIDEMIAEKGTFEDTLAEGWLTGDMFTEAMNIYSGVYSEAELAAKGFTQSQIENFKELAANAESAATEVKTFTQLWDVLKETAQSGWTQTWELIFGDFETAKATFTKLQVYFSNILNSWSDLRNSLIGGALNPKKTWAGILEKLEGTGVGKIVKVADTVEKLTDKLSDYQDIVNKVWRGDYGNSDTGRFEKLDELGWDHHVVQDLVNKGYQYKLTVDDVEASHKKFGLTMKTTTKETKKAAEAFETISDEKLRDAGLTEGEIRLYRALEEEAARTGRTISEVVDEMSKNDGRTMLIDSLKNAWSGLVAIFKAVKDAWVDIFPPMTVVQLYNIIKGIKELSTHLVVGDETAEKLTRTFKGVFAILDIITTLLGGPLKIAFKLLTQFLGVFDLDILDVTAKIGDVIVKFRDWLDSVLDFTGVFEKLAPYVKDAADAISKFCGKLKSTVVEKFSSALSNIMDKFSEWGTAFKESKFYQVGKNIVDGLKSGLKDGATSVFTAIWNFGKSILEKIKEVLGIHSPSTETYEIGQNLIQGLINGIQNGFSKIGPVLKTLFDRIVEAFKNFEWGKISFVFSNLGNFIPSLKPLFTTLATLSTFAYHFGKTILDKVKEVLGIHSPSTEFFEIGKNIVLGLVNGIKYAIGMLWTLVKTIGSKLIEMVGDLNLGTVISAGLTSAALVVLNNWSKTISGFSKPLAGLGAMFEDLGDMFEGIGANFKGSAMKKRGEAVRDMALAVLIMVGALYLLTKIDKDRLWESVVVLGILAGIVAGLAVAVSKLGTASASIDKNGANFKSTVAPILGIAASLLIVAIAMKQLASIENYDVGTVIGMFSAIIIGMGLLVGEISLLSKKTDPLAIAGFGKMLLSMSVAFLILTFVIKQISKLENGVIQKGIFVMAVLEVLFMAIVGISKFAGQWGSKAGSMLLKMSFAFIVMIGVIKLASKLSAGEIVKGIFTIGLVTALFVALVGVSQYAGQHAAKAGAAILMMSVAMLILVAVVHLVSDLDGKQLVKGLAAIVVMGVIFTALIAVSKLAGEHAAKAGTMLIAMSAAMLILVGVMFILSYMEPEGIKRGLAVITAIGLVFAGLIAVTKFASDAKGTLITLTIAVGLLAALLIALTFIDPQKLGVATAALTAVIGVFALLVFVTKYLKGGEQGWVKNLATLGVLVLVVGALALIIWRLSKCDPGSALESAKALSLLVVALAAVMFALGKLPANSIGNLAVAVIGLAAICVTLYILVDVLRTMDGIQNAQDNAITMSIFMGAMAVVLVITAAAGAIYSAMGGMAMLGLVGMAAICLTAYILVDVLKRMDGLQNAQDNAIAMSIFMGAMSIVLVITAAAGAIYAATGGIALAGVVGLAAVCLAADMLVDTLTKMDGLQNAEANAKLISNLMLVMAVVLVAVSLVGPLAMAGVSAMYALSGFMVAVGAFAVAVGWLMEHVDGLQECLDRGIPVLVQLAGGIGEMIGAFVGGIAAEFANRLPAIGTALTSFMTEAQGFVDGVTAIGSNTNMLNGVGTLVAAIGALTVGSFIDGLTKFSPFASSFAELGASLSAFMINAQDFILGCSALDPVVMDGVKTLVESILMLTGANLIDGITSFLFGESSLSEFALQLGSLGTGIGAFITALTNAGITPEAATLAQTAADIISKIAGAAKDIPNSGGLLGDIMGQNDIGTWGYQLDVLATGIASFITILTNAGITKESVDLAGHAASIITKIAEAAADIPNSGGWLGAIMGDNDIGTWGYQLGVCGVGIAGFIKAIADAGITKESVDIAGHAASIITKLAEAAQGIPNDGGVAGFFAGENGIGTWSKNLPTVGENIAGFVDKIKGMDDKAVSAAYAAARVIDAVADMTAKFDGSTFGDSGDFASFGKGLGTLANKIKDFVSKMSEIGTDGLSGATTKLNEVINAAKTVANTDISACKTFAKTFTNCAKDAVKGFVDAFKDEKPKSDVTKNVKALVKAALIGADSDEMREKFKSAGKHLVNGFCDGITENTFKAEAKAEAMAKAAKKAAEEALGIESPSKVFYSIGNFCVLGLTNALARGAANADKAGRNLAEASVNGLSRAMAMVGSVIDSDIDVQPTIRPIVDLSGVKTGAAAIGSMLSERRTLSIDTAKVNAVSASMAELQNGRNSDKLTSAIKGLRKDLANAPRNTYNVNGLSYSEGSDVAGALTELVRLIKIEGRA